MRIYSRRTSGSMSTVTTPNFVCPSQSYIILNTLHIATSGCHEAYYKSRCDQTVQNPSGNEQFTFLANELLKVEVSHKARVAITATSCMTLIRAQFSEADVHKLFTEAKLRPIQRWTDSASQYSLWLLERPPFSFPLLSHPKPSTSEEVSRPSYSVSPFGVPCMEDWENVWALWDFITRMIPPSMLFQKPIDLRE